MNIWKGYPSWLILTHRNIRSPIKAIESNLHYIVQPTFSISFIIILKLPVFKLPEKIKIDSIDTLIRRAYHMENRCFRYFQAKYFLRVEITTGLHSKFFTWRTTHWQSSDNRVTYLVSFEISIRQDVFYLNSTKFYSEVKIWRIGENGKVLYSCFLGKWKEIPHVHH